MLGALKDRIPQDAAHFRCKEFFFFLRTGITTKIAVHYTSALSSVARELKITY